MKNNCLVQYRGGGYDGCFWEWNYFFIDAEGRFFNIVATGRNGIRRTEDVESVIDDPHTHTYDVSNDGEMASFAKESNPLHVLGIVKWLIENGYGDHAAVYCSKCGGIITDLDTIYPEWNDPRFGGWRGDGGTGITCDEIYCDKCMENTDGIQNL
jgi:hypothetical protein